MDPLPRKYHEILPDLERISAAQYAADARRAALRASIWAWITLACVFVNAALVTFGVAR